MRDQVLTAEGLSATVGTQVAKHAEDPTVWTWGGQGRKKLAQRSSGQESSCWRQEQRAKGKQILEGSFWFC